MRRRPILGAAAAALAAVAVAAVLAAPPRTVILDPGVWSPTSPWVTVPGGLHVHTTASDGSGTLDEVTSAAAAAGLAFVIVTDHADGTGVAGSEYRSGVLSIGGVEISSRDGHVLALGAGRAPYPLGGDSRDVVEDVERLGGMTIAAHPDSPKPELAWQDPDVPTDGIEWVNLDSEWRKTPWWRAALAVLVYAARPAETVSSLIRRPDDLLARWDEALGRRPVVALGAVDAHGHVGLFDQGDPARTRLFALPLPSYESMFDALKLYAVLEGPLTGEPAADGRAILDALRAGRVYTGVDGLATPARFEFVARTSDGVVPMGASIREGPDAELVVRTVAPEGAEVVVFRDGAEIERSAEHEVTLAAPAAGVYRVEVRWAPDGAPVPWILSNAIRIGPAAATAAAEGPAPATAQRSLRQAEPEERLYPRGGIGAWALEHDEFSGAAIDEIETAERTALAYRFALATDTGDPPWTALVRGLPARFTGASVLRFEARADATMRVSVQVRAGERRWQRSVYLDQDTRVFMLPLSEFRPVDAASAADAITEATSLLFVVDTGNTAPGTAGIVFLERIQLIVPES